LGLLGIGAAGCWRLKTTDKTARRGKHRLEKWRLGKLQGAVGHGGGAARPDAAVRKETGKKKKVAARGVGE
jgi:hypothetical protein